MPPLDANYIFTASQLTIIVYLIVIFWIVDWVRGKPPSPGYAAPPCPLS